MRASFGMKTSIITFLVLTLTFGGLVCGPALMIKECMASPESSSIILNPQEVSIHIHEGEYYILKVNITNDSTMTTRLLSILHGREDITFVINSSLSQKWLMPSNSTVFFILFKAPSAAPTPYVSWVNFTFKDLGRFQLKYSLYVDEFSPLITPNPPYLYLETFRHEESIVKVIVKSLFDVNLTVTIDEPEELSEILIPFKERDIIPPRGEIEFPFLVRPWKIKDCALVSHINVTVIKPAYQRWRIPVVIVPHSLPNALNYTFFEKHSLLMNRTTIASGSTNSITFNISCTASQLIVVCNTTGNINDLEFTFIDPSGTKTSLDSAPIYVGNTNGKLFIKRWPMPGQWNLTISNTGIDDIPLTIRVFETASDFISGPTPVDREILIYGSLMTGEKKVLYLQVPTDLSFLSIVVTPRVGLTVELYDPLGNPLESGSEIRLIGPSPGVYRLELFLDPSAVGDYRNETIKIKISSIENERIKEIPIIITDYLNAYEQKFYRFYVPLGVSELTVRISSTGYLNAKLFDPTGEDTSVYPDSKSISDPEFGVWCLSVKAEGTSRYNISLEEIVAVYLGEPPIQVVGSIKSSASKVFKFRVPEGQSRLKVNLTRGYVYATFTLINPYGKTVKKGIYADIKNPPPGIWTLKLISSADTHFSLEILTGTAEYSAVEILGDRSFDIRSGSFIISQLTMRNLKNQTLLITGISSTDSWIVPISVSSREIRPFETGTIAIGVFALQASYGVYYGFLVVKSSWGTHFAELSMICRADMILVRNITKVITSLDILPKDLFLNLIVQNIGSSGAGISEVYPFGSTVTTSYIEYMETSIIKVPISLQRAGIDHVIVNITIGFSWDDYKGNWSFYVPITIICGSTYGVNVSHLENLESSVVASISPGEMSGMIDQRMSLVVNVTNRYSESIDYVLLLSSSVFDFLVYPYGAKSIAPGSSVILNTSIQPLRWMDISCNPFLFLKCGAEVLYLVPQTPLMVHIFPGISISGVTHTPESPYAHDYIMFGAKTVEAFSQIVSVYVLYEYDDEEATIPLELSENGTFENIISPIYTPTTVKFVVFGVANGRLGYFIADNNSAMYKIVVLESPPARLFNIEYEPEKEAYKPGEVLKVSGNLTKGLEPLLHVYVKVSILNPANSVIWEDLILTDENGQFRIEYEIPADASEGKYLINVTYTNISEVRPFYVDGSPPLISSITVSPEAPHVGETIIIQVSASDAITGVERVILSYSYGGGWVNITMTREGDIYKATIYADHEGELKYKVYAYDLAGNVAVSEEKSVYIARPEWQTWLIYGGIGGGVAALGAAAYVIMRRRRMYKKLFE